MISRRLGMVGAASGFLAAVGFSYMLGYDKGSSMYNQRGIPIEPLAVADFDKDGRLDAVYRVRSLFGRGVDGEGLGALVYIDGKDLNIADGRCRLMGLEGITIKNTIPDNIDCTISVADYDKDDKLDVRIWFRPNSMHDLKKYFDDRKF